VEPWGNFLRLHLGKTSGKYKLAFICYTKRESIIHLIVNNKNMKPFALNIEKETLENNNFRKVLYTSQHGQVVLMSLLPQEEIGAEIHETTDQFFRVESGEGKAVINGEEFILSDGMAVVVSAGSLHNVINTSSDKLLKVYTIYMPAHHKDGVVHATKAEAEADAVDHL
jgi:mannose-6-phosphate isomerase-like protein (cupin superfamily)